MKRTDPVLNKFLGKSVHNFRKENKYTIDVMSEKLREDRRSYSDQEKGRMGFSGQTLIYYLIQLTDMEAQIFIHKLKALVEKKEKGELDEE